MNEIEVLINAKTIIEVHCKSESSKIRVINYLSDLIYFLKEKE